MLFYAVWINLVNKLFLGLCFSSAAIEYSSINFFRPMFYGSYRKIWEQPDEWHFFAPLTPPERILILRKPPYLFRRLPLSIRAKFGGNRMNGF